MSDERWKETYDQWKCSPDDDYDERDEDEDDYDDEDEDEWVLDCGYEGCCMPAYHFRSECHNAADIEAYEASVYAVQSKDAQP